MNKIVHPSKFEFFDVTADIGIRAYGRSLNESFQNVALAMFEVMTDTEHINSVVKRTISLESEDQSALLYDWLSELIFIHDYEDLVFRDFKVEITRKDQGTYTLHAEMGGEEFKQSIHEVRDEVKAVTFHLMEIKNENGFMVQVILDT